MPLQPGARLGPYEIVAPIGAGGMGEVYRATDTRLDRTVAVKVLPALLAEALEFRERFEREARSISALARQSAQMVLAALDPLGDHRVHRNPLSNRRIFYALSWTSGVSVV